MPDDLKVTGLDHIVLQVADPEVSVAFYCGELGMAAEHLEEWRRHEVLFPSVRVDVTTIIDLLPGPPTGANVDHFCLVVEETDFVALSAAGRFDVVEGPVRRSGAQGVGTSLYIRDPDRNLVELRYYRQDEAGVGSPPR
jgi:catechol 2,3-dioxygenase-like lactoylglutathione lyase family enzyme